MLRILGKLMLVFLAVVVLGLNVSGAEDVRIPLLARFHRGGPSLVVVGDTGSGWKGDGAVCVGLSFSGAIHDLLQRVTLLELTGKPGGMQRFLCRPRQAAEGADRIRDNCLARKGLLRMTKLPVRSTDLVRPSMVETETFRVVS